MKLLNIFGLFLFLAAVVVAYFRYRDPILDLATSTDSKRSGTFLKIMALLFAFFVVFLSAVFRHGGFHWSRAR